MESACRELDGGTVAALSGSHLIQPPNGADGPRGMCALGQLRPMRGGSGSKPSICRCAVTPSAGAPDQRRKSAEVGSTRVTVAVIDVETTGLSPRTDRVVEVAEDHVEDVFEGSLKACEGALASARVVLDTVRHGRVGELKQCGSSSGEKQRGLLSDLP